MSADNFQGYKRIESAKGRIWIIESTSTAIIKLAKVVKAYMNISRSDQFVIKTKVIDCIAETEIFLKLFKDTIGVGDELGAGILTALKRAKIKELQK